MVALTVVLPATALPSNLELATTPLQSVLRAVSVGGSDNGDCWRARTWGLNQAPATPPSPWHAVQGGGPDDGDRIINNEQSRFLLEPRTKYTGPPNKEEKKTARLAPRDTREPRSCRSYPPPPPPPPPPSSVPPPARPGRPRTSVRTVPGRCRRHRCRQGRPRDRRKRRRSPAGMPSSATRTAERPARRKMPSW